MNTPHSDPTVENLIRAVDRLERENRWLRSAVFLPWIAVGAVFALSAFREVKVLEAERFVLRDSHGTARAVLEPTVQGCRLLLSDSGGHSMASLSTRSIGPSIALMSEQGKECVRLDVDKGEPVLSLYDEKDGRRRVTMIVQPDRSGLLFTDRKESDRLTLLDKPSGPEMRMRGALVVPAKR